MSFNVTGFCTGPFWFLTWVMARPSLFSTKGHSAKFPGAAGPFAITFVSLMVLPVTVKVPAFTTSGPHVARWSAVDLSAPLSGSVGRVASLLATNEKWLPEN